MNKKQVRRYIEPSVTKQVASKLLVKRKLRNLKQSKTEKSAQHFNFRISKVMIGFPTSRNRSSSCNQIAQSLLDLRKSSQGHIKHRIFDNHIQADQVMPRQSFKSNKKDRKLLLSPLNKKYREESLVQFRTNNSIEKFRKEHQQKQQIQQQLNIQQRFYEQVKILQQFKHLRRMVN